MNILETSMRLCLVPSSVTCPLIAYCVVNYINSEERVCWFVGVYVHIEVEVILHSEEKRPREFWR